MRMWGEVKSSCTGSTDTEVQRGLDDSKVGWKTRMKERGGQREEKTVWSRKWELWIYRNDLHF